MQLFNYKTLVLGAGLFLTAAPAFATTINNIDFPGTPGQHVFAGTAVQNVVLEPGQKLTGYGQVTTIEGYTSFCASGNSCQLTYSFGGFNLEEITPTTANFSGGYVDFYTNEDGLYDPTDGSTATSGDLFLSTVADAYASGFTLEGKFVNSGTPQAQNTATGLLSVTGGPAESFFDNDSYESGDGLSDLLFNSSFSPEGELIFTGSADAHYVKDVPEPTELAMLGLGIALIGVGLQYRRRKDV